MLKTSEKYPNNSLKYKKILYVSIWVTLKWCSKNFTRFLLGFDPITSLLNESQKYCKWYKGFDFVN